MDGRSGTVVLILDPKVPGYPDGFSLESVLGPPDPALIAMVQRHLDGAVVAPPVAAGQSEDAQLHLCCDAGTYGLAEPVRRHRPLSAKDLS